MLVHLVFWVCRTLRDVVTPRIRRWTISPVRLTLIGSWVALIASLLVWTVPKYLLLCKLVVNNTVLLVLLISKPLGWLLKLVKWLLAKALALIKVFKRIIVPVIGLKACMLTILGDKLFALARLKYVS